MYDPRRPLVDARLQRLVAAGANLIAIDFCSLDASLHARRHDRFECLLLIRRAELSRAEASIASPGKAAR